MIPERVRLAPGPAVGGDAGSGRPQLRPDRGAHARAHPRRGGRARPQPAERHRPRRGRRRLGRMGPAGRPAAGRLRRRPGEPDGASSASPASATAAPRDSSRCSATSGWPTWPAPPRGIDAVRLFAGYAGWGGGQLEGEIAEGAWFVVDADPGDALTADPDSLWEDVLRRQGGRLAMFALCPVRPVPELAAAAPEKFSDFGFLADFGAG